MNNININNVLRILHNHNQRLDKMEQNISQLCAAIAKLNKATAEHQQQNDMVMIPKFRFVKTKDKDVYRIESLFPNPEYTDFEDMPSDVTPETFYGKTVGNLFNASGLCYTLTYFCGVDPNYFDGKGFYNTFVTADPTADTSELDLNHQFQGETLYDCGLTSDPYATLEFDKEGKSQAFDLLYKGKPVYIVPEVVNGVIIPSDEKHPTISRIGYKLSYPIRGCEYAIALTKPMKASDYYREEF